MSDTVYLDRLEALAKAASANDGDFGAQFKWSECYAMPLEKDREASVIGPDGDQLVECYGNLVYGVDSNKLADFIAALNPAVVLQWVAETRELANERDENHRAFEWAKKLWCDALVKASDSRVALRVPVEALNSCQAKAELAVKITRDDLPKIAEGFEVIAKTARTALATLSGHAAGGQGEGER